MKEFEGKKLLILGGNPETTPLVEIANQMGIKTIVASARKTDPAKKAAWKASDVDGMDVSGLIALAKEEKVDGVLVGVADILVPSYCKVCDALNLPCYATEQICKVFSFKDEFKETCEKFGIHGIPQFHMTAECKPEDVAKVKYPVMVKPVDNGGGVGMTVVYKEEDLKDAVEKALEASKTKRFIVEKYMRCDDVGLYFMFKDGYCNAASVFDRYTTSEQPGLSRVNLGSVYPSRHMDDFFSKVYPNACNLFKEIGIKNGVLLLQAFYENGEFYVYDTGFRLQGEAPHLLIKAINGYDQRELLIRFALTGSYGEVELHDEDAYFKGKAAATLWFLLKKGTIAKIEGLDDVPNDKNIVANIQRLHEGDTVPEEWVGTERQVLTRLYIVCDRKEDLAKELKKYMASVKVYDTEGNNMVLTGFNVDNALNEKRGRLEGKVIVVSGGTKGVGKAAAEAFVKEGAKVVAAGRDEKSKPKGCLFVHTDLHNLGDIKNLFKTAYETYGKIDGFFNYAGVTPFSPLDSCPEDVFDEVMDVNFKGAFYCCQEAVNYMRKGIGGSIVLTGSPHANGGEKDRAVYACSKGVLYTLMEHIAKNYADEKIRCNYLTLGWTLTEGEIELRKQQHMDVVQLQQYAKGFIPAGHMNIPQDYVEALIYAMSDASYMMTGSNMRITGGFYI